MEIVKRAKDIRYVYIREDNGKLKKKFIYKCCICDKEIIDYRPVRFIKNLFGYGKYKQYYPVRNYDFCDSCYKTLTTAIDKWKRKKREGV